MTQSIETQTRLIEKMTKRCGNVQEMHILVENFKNTKNRQKME